MTAERLALLTADSPLMPRETTDLETPARVATSTIVAARGEALLDIERGGIILPGTFPEGTFPRVWRGGGRLGDLHVGLIGTGRIGTLHARTLKASARVSKLTIVDADHARAARVAAELGAA